ncbi:hypothetical protein QBC35DRAFT_515434 [Podospora australis]|uniref:Glucose-methanol-choline oxidoreductase N-terminal domain-containing protein n=1 Tax=Podospora australis TaxID=1536484 RepID=A0AAN7AJ18_9PEZI|nr:hypothetical protein QBC35DRAFT_515434 [Podospora australis]
MAAVDLEKPFDYVIVGGGTAGLVVANRLSEDSDVRVLVIEAGGDRTADPLVLCPGLVAGLYGKDEYDWNFTSPPQPSLNNRQIRQPRGKMLGGSSALNFLMLLYPSNANIDAWAALGNDGWDFDSLAPYFRKFATVHAPPQSAKDMVGITYHDETLAQGDGPIQVSFSEGYTVNNKAWMETFAQQGLSVTTDVRTGKALGAFQNQATIDPATKTRSYAASGYLTPEVRQRPNLVVLTETLVTKILFDTSSTEPVATGVEVLLSTKKTQTILANQEVILSAGTLQSPQLLELSGIGNPTLLSQHSIPCLVPNPGVGENVQDHPIVCQSFQVLPDTPSGDVLRDPALLQSLVGLYTSSAGAGPLGQSVISVAYSPLVDSSGILSPSAKSAIFAPHEESLKSSPAQSHVRKLLESSQDEAAFQYLLFPTQISIPAAPKAMTDYILPVLPDNYLTIMTILNHPFSRGSVHITSSDPTQKPLWDPKYNSHELDLELLARGVQFVERLVAPETPLGKLLEQKLDGKAAEAGKSRLPEIVATDLDKAKEIVRQRQISVFHVAGSCAMLPRGKGGVVDSRLRVYGVKALRVVDASVIPLEPLGNIQSVVYALAERAADLIKEDRNGR